MRTNTYILYAKATLAALLSAPLLWACSEEEVPDPQLYTPEGVPFAYVSIGFSTGMNPVTKAETPTGGEDGDGPEAGQDYENQINDIHLFFYNVKDPASDPDNTGADGVNMNPDTAIVAHKYLTSGEFSYNNNGTGTESQATTHSIPVENLLVGNSYHVLAVVNAGDAFVSTLQSPLTLGSLQQATVTKLYTYDETNGYRDFLMSSESNENTPLQITDENSERNPASTKIWVERVTARVDYKKEESYDVPYSEEGTTTDKIGTAKILGAMLINTLNETAESYLLKRVTEGSDNISGSPIWLGDETYTKNTGAATNYVIAPLTTTMTAANATKIATNFSTANYFPSFSYDTADDWEDLFIEGTPITTNNETWNRIGYPKENTAQNADYRYTTGVVFKADFTPIIDGTKLADDATFFEWNGKIYATVEAAMEAFDSQSWSRIAETDFWNDINTWDDLRNKIIAGIKDNDPAGYKEYLIKQAEDKDGTDNIGAKEKAALRWSNYMKTECHYKVENNVVLVDTDKDKDGSTRSALAPFGLATYYKGICYYTYWIKHANDQNDTNDMGPLGLINKGGVMEYGIVRNNIYKLEVTGISQLGNDIPGNRTLLINVSVRNWEEMNESDEIELEPNTGNE